MADMSVRPRRASAAWNAGARLIASLSATNCSPVISG